MEEKEIQDNIFQEEQDDKRPYPRLDRTILDPKERNKRVHQIVNSVSPDRLTPYYLEQLTKYLTETTQNKKEKTIFS